MIRTWVPTRMNPQILKWIKSIPGDAPKWVKYLSQCYWQLFCDHKAKYHQYKYVGNLKGWKARRVFLVRQMQNILAHYGQTWKDFVYFLEHHEDDQAEVAARSDPRANIAAEFERSIPNLSDGEIAAGIMKMLEMKVHLSMPMLFALHRIKKKEETEGKESELLAVMALANMA